MAVHYFIGLDLGQAQETTALAVLEQGESTPRRYSLRFLRRWPPGAGYVAMAEEVERLCQSLPAMPIAAVDITAVGMPVLSLFGAVHQRAGVYPITITSGHAVTPGPHGPLVPRKELVATVQVLLQARRLRIARELPDAQTLTAELTAFKSRVMPEGVETGCVWRERPHDDLVLAVALAAWLGENRVEPYTGPLVYWPPVPFGSEGQSGTQLKSRTQQVFDELGIDPDGDWE